MWKKTNLVVGIGVCVLFAGLAFAGVKSPFGGVGKTFKSSGRGGSGIYYYGGGK